MYICADLDIPISSLIEYTSVHTSILTSCTSYTQQTQVMKHSPISMI